jgi:D-lactate dehydrogenase
MKIAVFSSKKYDREFLQAANQKCNYELQFFEPRLEAKTAPLSQGFDVACAFVNDKLDHPTLEILARNRIKIIALRCAGFNNVDLQAAKELNLPVVRVPAYSPYAVAEHTIALILSLNRKIHRAFYRVREGNFALDGLLGFDLNDCTVGIIGTGKIGQIVSKILHGFGCKIIAYDLYPNSELIDRGVEYLSLHELAANADIITLHCPLTPENQHLIDVELIAKMKTGVMLINTSRGGLIDTKAAIDGLKSQKIGYLALDVYEGEESLFFEDRSDSIIQDDIFERLLTFPNVIITGHQAFFTRNALQNIAETTLANIQQIQQGNPCSNQINSY